MNDSEKLKELVEKGKKLSDEKTEAVSKAIDKAETYRRESRAKLTRLFEQSP